MSAPFFAPPVVVVPRDGGGRPLITPPGETEPVPYHRASDFAQILSDPRPVDKWLRRLTARGIAEHPGLLAQVAEHRDDPTRLDWLCDAAAGMAGANAARDWGDALHKLAELRDLGEDPPVPVEFEADLNAYLDATRHLEFCEVERFRVLDPWRVAGTPDRVARVGDRLVIFDIKTGKVKREAAMQLALYSRSLRYDPATAERPPDPLPVDQDWAIVAHVPAREGRCKLRWIDIRAGWRHCLTARDVLAARAVGLRQLTKPYTVPTTQ